ncbi:hypothetical protein GCM10011509_22660 [Ornithinimicrobium pekingense]|uniref:DUF2746 domain-containing protein n=1 Tax=Ornithinimicrobium pekingense TaxID=384677 RepID=A0ABQ2FA46_9MICO|nr:hypothetical protein GCM10011509_22660 [Ornithinimicrobium pekingense]
MLAVLGLVGALTVVLAVTEQWALAVTGLVALQLGTAVAVLGPWGAGRARAVPAASGSSTTTVPTSAGPAAGGGEELADLQRRVDALGARLVASTERTRVELLDALHDRSRDGR